MIYDFVVMKLSGSETGTNYPDIKVHGANMGPTWVLSAPDGPHVGPMNLANRVVPSYPCRGPILQQTIADHAYDYDR